MDQLATEALVTTSLKDIDFSQVSLAERALLTHELQASLRAEADAAPVSDEYLAELRRRVAEIEAGSVPLLTWEQVRSSVFGPG